MRGFAEDLFRVAEERQEQIDELIKGHSQNWRLERMPAVDRNLLRMAVAEMLGFKATPFPIVINEALEIARRYSRGGVHQFPEWRIGFHRAQPAAEVSCPGDHDPHVLRVHPRWPPLREIHSLFEAQRPGPSSILVLWKIRRW